ncbi:hypothetical protein HMPREF0542_12240 [Ligilactobacillus ruminis ATCC 25644]|uniref:Uncharacterized protein n=1 Tax=Ligilactobacillus ruminis ATCC 25644 TaxID=525362 RepID=E7FTL2_9LACO|nr:hypothetical protein HMPREF0542_12240 [Ligilactobacillus ruminis ATCC 25644]
MESAVEHFLNFGEFCSTFEAARPKFRQAGRQKRGISPVFCLLLVPRTPIQTYCRDSAKARDFETMFDAGDSAF